MRFQKRQMVLLLERIPKAINSSFVGDISNSMVNESWGKEDIPKKTDGAFVGENTIQADNTYFAGDDYDKDEQKGNSCCFCRREFH